MTSKPFSLSVKAVVLDDNHRCLLLQRSMNSRGNPGKWDLPGGKMDAGETLDEALVREVEEETGLVTVVRHVLGAAEAETPEVRVAYLFLQVDVISGDLILSDEHDDYRWVDRHDLMSLDVVDQFCDFFRTYSQGGVSQR